MTKSSGFSSFSSLLSSTDPPLEKKTRSVSMPSICIAVSSSIDDLSTHLDDSAFEQTSRARRPMSFTEDTLHSSSTQTTSHLANHPSSQLETFINTDHSSTTQTRFASTDLLEIHSNEEKRTKSSGSADDILLKSKDETSTNERNH